MFPKFEQNTRENNSQEATHYAKAVEATSFVSAESHSPEDLENACAVYQKHLERMQPYFKVFAGSLSVPFEFTTSVSTAAFDHHNGKMLLGVEWFIEKKLTPAQASWVCLHELSHFIDFAGDSKRYKENSEKDCVEGAERIVEHAEKSYRRIFGEAMPPEMKGIIEREAQGGIFDNFYNTTDDIWVNNNVSHKASMYSRDLPAGKEITSLYSDILFPAADFKNFAAGRGDRPRHMQFGEGLLRKEMVPEEDVVLSDDVNEALKKKIKYNNKLYSSEEIINKFIKPGAGRVVTFGRRHDVLDETLLPVFEELYKKDIDDALERLKKQREDKKKKEEEKKEESEKSPEEKKEETKENPEEKKEPEEEKENIEPQNEVPEDGSFFGDSHKQGKKNTPDIINIEDIEKWFQHTEEKMEKEKAATEARIQKEKDMKNAEADKSWCEKNKIEFPLFQEYQRVESSIAPYREDLARLWRRIAFGESRGVEKSVTSGSKSGERVHIPSIIESYPDILAGDFGNVRVMERIRNVEKKIEKPERIEISILLDRSGSMYSKGNLKTDVATQAVVLLLASIEDFNGYLASARSRTRTALHADTEVIVYGNNAFRAKSFRGNKSSIEEKKDAVTVMNYVYEDYGYTYDNKALQIVNDATTPAVETQIKRGKVMKIVFDITDGVAEKPKETIKEIGELDRHGVIVRAFQIGGQAEEQEEFSKIWNNGDTKHGFVIGRNVNNLVPAIIASLEEYLGGIEI